MDSFHGTVCWNELMTADVEKARAYYEKLMGWRTEVSPMGHDDYYLFWREGADMPTAGMMAFPDDPYFEHIPPHWFTYLAVDDVDKSVEETLAMGGELKRPIFDIENVGRIAIIADPTGAVVGLMTPIPPQQA